MSTFEAVLGYEALTRFEDGRAPDMRFAEAAAVGLVSLEPQGDCHRGESIGPQIQEGLGADESMDFGRRESGVTSLVRYFPLSEKA